MERDLLEQEAPLITVEYKPPQGMQGIIVAEEIDPRTRVEWKDEVLPLTAKKVRIIGGYFSLFSQKEREQKGLLGEYIVRQFGRYNDNHIFDVLTGFYQDTRRYQILLDRSIRMEGFKKIGDQQISYGDEIDINFFGRFNGKVYLEDKETYVADYDLLDYRPTKGTYPVFEFEEAHFKLPYFDPNTNSFRLPE